MFSLTCHSSCCISNCTILASSGLIRRIQEGTHVFQEIRAPPASTILRNSCLLLSLLEYIPHLKLLYPSPIHLIPDRTGPRRAQLRQLLVREFDRLCSPKSACIVKIRYSIFLPFLIFRYQIGPPIFTIVLVRHSTSVRGILQTFSII